MGDGVTPGPGSYSPLIHTRGSAAGLAEKVVKHLAHNAAHPRATTAPAASIGFPPRKAGAAIQLRRCTLGDGSTMLLPMPGVSAPKPQVLKGHQNAILKHGARMQEAKRYAMLTENAMEAGRGEPWAAGYGEPAKLPPRIAVKPPWVLTKGDHSRPSTRCGDASPQYEL